MNEKGDILLEGAETTGADCEGEQQINDWKVGSESKAAEMVGFVYFLFFSFLTGFNGAGRVGSARAVA